LKKCSQERSKTRPIERNKEAMEVPADGGHGLQRDMLPGEGDTGQMMEYADDSGMLAGDVGSDVSDVCVAGTSDQGSRGFLSRGQSAEASSIGSPVEQLDAGEPPKMEPHAVAGGSNGGTGPVRDDGFQSKRNS